MDEQEQTQQENDEAIDALKAASEEVEADTESESTGEATGDDIMNERDELYARLQRVSADFMNFQKRAETNLRDSIELARADVLRQIIPVLDHFDHALDSAPDTEEAQQIYGGLRIVRDELLKVLTQAGVSKIEPTIGDAFDPHLHEALMRQPAEGIDANHITMIMQPGYAHGERTLRAAKVAVAPAE